jgi:AraC family transcriptional regulator
MQIQILPSPRNAPVRLGASGVNLEESAVVCLRASRYEASIDQRLLALLWVRGGREQVMLEGRTLTIDDDTYLVINDSSSYDVRIASATPMQSFAVYFERGLADEYAASHPEIERPIRFGEHLHSHDSLVSPVLRFIEHQLDLGITQPEWYEEQLPFLLERMFRKEARNDRREAAIDAARRATRREAVRRVALATDYIHSCYERSIVLADIGAAAALSPHHLLRLFKLVHGCTPREYLQAKRSRVAARLIASTEMTLEEIAHRVGFEDRSTLGRQLRRLFGMNPRQMRLEQRTCSNPTT